MTDPATKRRHAKLLVLDLDETLIHARARGEAELPWPPQRQVAHFRVYLRPGVREFMNAALDRFVAVGVWTSATTDYATAMLERIVDRRRLRFIYCRERCTQRRDVDLDETYWIKDIRKLDGFGFDKHQILVVDDKPRGLERSYGNLVRIPPFEGDPEDRTLARLGPYLDQLGAVEDVRAVEKRGWWLRDDEDDV
ncbi:NLI interacting factor-like phosphatase [Enhygromyxa salina]|uniref:NLI interacting factor-like phosphatase n=1 Tax=Enhygromyxa salina TaxID=215803 RepID=A0A2S9XEL8_9BACT|nr:HAD family hydrolase [Enhygromyxa salina]PRP91316.1 NLI interacting factor-like phosphatase [Enhygromyxa salina]